MGGLPDLVWLLVNEAMQIEREHYLGVKPYKPNDARKGHANGYKPKTRLGDVTFEIETVRISV